MSHSKPEVMQAKKVRVDGKPMSPKDEVISPKKLKGVSKNPWECRVKKMAKDTQKEINGTKEPTSNVRQSPNDHIESLRGE